MRPEDQVCSLELSKQLKELGVKQESFIRWIYAPFQGSLVVTLALSSEAEKDPSIKSISAFTVAELGDMLPHQIPGGVYLSRKRKDIKSDEKVGGWEVLYQDNSGISCMELGVNEADARAKMLIYLIEKGLVKP